MCESYGKKVLVIGGRKALAAAYDKIAAYVAQTNLEIIGTEIYGENCTYATVERLRALPLYQEADMVFGVGGGKALDTVKCLCIPDDKPVFSFPTIASNCAATTSVSILYNEDGTFLKPHFFIRPVMHAFIDTQIIAQAPSQYMWAGIGDTYAKYYEALISSRDERLEHFTAVGVAVSQMCRDPLLLYSAQALEDHKQGLCTYAVEQVVLAIVVTTGIASIFLTKDYTPDYNSGLAHAIFYATTAYCADSPVLVELACENATIRMEEQEVSITWADGSKERHSLTSKPVAGGKAYWGNSHGLCIQDFYRCVREGKPFRNDIAGIADTAELMLSMYQSAREHTVVEL